MRPLEHGLNTAVHVFLTPSRLHISLKGLYLKFLPSNLMTKFALTAVCTFRSGIAHTSSHYMKWSVAARMSLWPFLESGHSPLMSSETLCRGMPTWYFYSEALWVLFGNLCAAHISHHLHQVSTKWHMQGQKNLDLTLASVHLIPKWTFFWSRCLLNQFMPNTNRVHEPNFRQIH